MLALDSTIGCIEASEPDVLDLYRSAPLMTSPVTDAQQESREAYVCAIRKKARVQVYVALVADNKRIFVYTHPGEPETEQHYQHYLQEALAFARSLGFAPERIDLNYSPAMREVVVRNIKILRPPGSKVHALLKHGMADAPTPAGVKRPGALKKHPPPSPPAAPSLALAVTSEAGPSLALAVTSEAAPSLALAVTSEAAPEAGIAPAGASGAASQKAPLSASQTAAPKSSSPAMASTKAAATEATAPDTSVATASPAATSSATRPPAPCAASTGEAVLANPVLATAGGLAPSPGVAQLAARQVAPSRVAEDNRASDKRAIEEAASLREKLARALSDGEKEQEKLATVRAELLASQKAREKAEVESISNLRKELATLLAAKDALSVKLQGLSARLLASTAELAAAGGERDRLRAEKQALELRIVTVEATGSELALLQRDEIAALSAQRDAAQLRTGELERESSAGASEMEALRGAIATLSTQQEAAQLGAGELARESSARAAQIEVLHGEIAELSRERDAALLRAGRLEKESPGGEAEMQALRGEIATLTAQRDASLLHTVMLEKESLARAAEVEALHCQVAMLSTQREAALHHARRLENEVSARAAEAKVQPRDPAAPPADLEVLQEQEGGFSFVKETKDAAAPEPRNVEPASPGDLKEVAERGPEPAKFTPRWDTQRSTDSATDWFGAATEKLVISPGFQDSDDDFFPAGADSEGCPGRFLLQERMTAVEYVSPAEVVELHKSINLAYLSPDGKGQASCQGYICCLRTTAGALQVFVAFFAELSGRTWVYHPEVQPEDQSDYAKAMAGATHFAEGVGFMMEQLPLGPETRHHDEAVGRCQVLRGTVQR